MLANNPPDFHHPADVIAFVKHKQDKNIPCALLVITDIEGGTLRARGSLMAICAHGEVAGYISNGCIDADIINHAQSALISNQSIHLHYGENSPFKDIQLACGGSLKILILPAPNAEIIKLANHALTARNDFDLVFEKSGKLTCPSAQTPQTSWEGEQFHVTYTPKLKLRIIGRGAHVKSLSLLGQQSGFEIVIQSPEENFKALADTNAAIKFEHLSTPDAEIALTDDPWTAVVFLFHDHAWESVLLKQALSGPAFYIGALGSKSTHKLRCETLEGMGATSYNIKKIHAPIGLIPAMRNAGLIAISTLAEILDVAQKAGKL